MKCKYGQNGVCEKLFRPNCPDDSSCFEFEMFSNADRIRAMSDEELAEFLCHFRSDEAAEHACSGCKGESYCRAGHGGMIDWLRKPAKEEQHDT